MLIKVLFFGMLKDTVGKSELELEMPIENTLMLKDFLEKKFPTFSKTNYLVAVNQNIVREETQINDGDEIALLPPFSGG